jgi:dTMP kinase
MNEDETEMTLSFETPPFVVIEGLDGAGTTTQALLLVQRLRGVGQAAHMSREPSEGPIGMLIRQMLSRRIVTPRGDDEYETIGRETLALLFAADRLDHISSKVQPSLNRGEVAVSDRYYHSSLAYQGDVDDEDDIDLEWVRTINERALTPDLTVFLEASAELCLERMSDRPHRDIFETEEKLSRLETRYDQVISALEDAGEHIFRLDASRTAESLSSEIFEEVASLAPHGSG